MKYVLTNKNNEIIEISNTHELDEEHRNINVDNNRAIAYGPDEKINVYEVEEIPGEVEIAKYCYTEEKGFYKNENYVEPYNEEKEMQDLKEQVKTLTKEKEDLAEQITEIQLAMIEMSELSESEV